MKTTEKHWYSLSLIVVKRNVAILNKMTYTGATAKKGARMTVAYSKLIWPIINDGGI
jgi:hypothetical protein